MSRFGGLAAGSAAGLGNLWRFPIPAAKDGGGIFLLIYIVLAIATCVMIGWFTGTGLVCDEIKPGGVKFRRETLYRFMVKYVAPVLLFVILLQSFGVFHFLDPK